MLKTIAEVSPVLLSFIDELDLPLSRPQKRHIAQVADALITTEGSKTLSALYRNIVGDPCPKSAADTFREAPWTADDLRVPLRAYLVGLVFKMAAEMGLAKHVFLSVDDSTTDKDKHSRRLQMVDWFIDLGRSLPGKLVFTKGTVYVLLRITIGPLSFTIDTVPYLRASTVRRLNRRLKHRRYNHVKVTAADEKRPKTYLVRSLVGKLSILPDEVRVYISKRHSRDTRPRYYGATNPSLSAHRALNDFHVRWSCEVANWYIKERLGWADCRLWKVESTEKFMMVLWLALAYLEFRKAQEYSRKSLADVIRLHRNAHARRLLEEACHLVLQLGSIHWTQNEA